MAVPLTSLSHGAGCGCKIGAADLGPIVAGLPPVTDPRVLVGSATYGKGSVQEPTRLSDGSILELTVGRYLTPSGRSLERVGVAPDVLVPADAAPGVAERRAAEVLGGLVASLAPAERR